MSGLGPSLDLRLWRNPVTGFRYRVRMSPRELAGPLGVDRRLNAVVFETSDGDWLGSVPISRHTALWSLDDRDLTGLLERARGLG